MMVKYGQSGTLSNILAPSSYTYAGTQLQKPDMFYYEILELSLKELEQRKGVRITWLPDGIVKEVS